MTHASYHYGGRNNERLEFFGDAVLKLVVSEYLFQYYRNYNEGQLTQLRAWIVSDEALVILAKDMQLGALLRLSKNEHQQGGAWRASILANAFEALLGAIYIDQSLAVVEQFLLPKIETVLVPLIQQNYHQDHKTMLQEKMQKNRLPLPVYCIVDTQGKEHHKHFVVSVTVDWHGCMTKATGQGSGKKSAEQQAAKSLLQTLEAKVEGV